MKKGPPQRDWAERTAKRVLSNDKLTLGFGSNSVEDIAALAKLLRRAGDRCTPRKARSTAMTKGPQRDWAALAAARIMHVHANDLADWPWSRRLKLRAAVLCALRRAERRGYERGLNARDPMTGARVDLKRDGDLEPRSGKS